MIFFTRRGKAGARVNFVEWVQSTGTQKIDTGVAVKSTIGYEVEFAMTTTTGQQGVIGGFTYGGYNHNFAAYNGKWFTQYGNNAGQQFGTADTNKHTLSQNVTAGVVKFDGVTLYTGLTYYNNTDKTFALFCYNGGSSYPQFWPGSLKLYRCRMYDNGVLIRDFRPCYDTAGVACLYDEIEGKYYYNQGTGDFVAPSENQGTVPDVGTVWVYTEDSRFTVPVDGNYQVELHGGGGGGGGSSYTLAVGGSAGGGGGGSGMMVTASLVRGDTIPITIGKGGSAGTSVLREDADSASGTAGGTGGTTIFGSHSISGGVGGGAGSENYFGGASYGSGGQNSGSISTAGTAGMWNRTLTAGIGGQGNVNNTAQTYGDGGNGSILNGSPSAGQPGAVIITYLGT